jgi:hypothetical protein
VHGLCSWWDGWPQIIQGPKSHIRRLVADQGTVA